MVCEGFRRTLALPNCMRDHRNLVRCEGCEGFRVRAYCVGFQGEICLVLNPYVARKNYRNPRNIIKKKNRCL